MSRTVASNRCVRSGPDRHPGYRPGRGHRRGLATASPTASSAMDGSDPRPAARALSAAPPIASAPSPTKENRDASSPDLSRRLHRRTVQRPAHDYRGCDLDRGVYRLGAARADDRSGDGPELSGVPVDFRRVCAGGVPGLRGQPVFSEWRTAGLHRAAGREHRRARLGTLADRGRRHPLCEQSRSLGQQPGGDADDPALAQSGALQPAGAAGQCERGTDHAGKLHQPLLQCHGPAICGGGDQCETRTT